MIRFAFLVLLSVSASSAFGQTAPPVETRPAARSLDVRPISPNLTAEQLAEYAAYVKKCLRGHEPIRNWVKLLVTIDPDGMVTGDPEIVSPIDSDEFRENVKTVLKKVHQCEPFIVDPSGRIKRTFIQPFNFAPGGLDRETYEVVREHFGKCRTPPKTGREVRVGLKYKPDGTYAKPPQLLDPENTAEYSEASTAAGSGKHRRIFGSSGQGHRADQQVSAAGIPTRQVLSAAGIHIQVHEH